MKKIILFFLLSMSLYANAGIALRDIMDSYNFSYLTIENGLPNNYIDDIFKDSKGFLWLATSNGLVRYDGYDFKLYSTLSDAVQLKSNFVKKVCEDNYNRLWIASEGGIDIIDLQVNRIAAITLPEEMKDKSCSMLFKDNQDNIWCVLQEEIHKITFTDTGEIKTISSLNTVQKKEGHPISAIAQIDGEIWIGYKNSIYKIFDKEGELHIVSLFSAEIFDSNLSQIHCMMQTEREVWVGTNRGLYRYHLDNRTHQRYRYDVDNPTSISQSYVTGLGMIDSNQIIITTLKGINFYNSEKDSFIRLEQDGNNVNKGLNCNFINSLYIDHEAIWIGTEMGGLNIMTRKSLELQTFVHDKDNPKSLSENPVNAIYEDPNGNLWVGNVEGGLSLKLKNTDHFIHFKNSKTNPYSISHNSISVLVPDNNNRLWIGTWGMGINVTSLDNPGPMKRFIRYNTETGTGLKNDFIGSMCYDPINNGMWIGTIGGLYFFDFRKERLDNVPLSANKLYNTTIASMCIDNEARLWIGTSKGLLIIDLLSFAKNHSDFVHIFRKYKLNESNTLHVERINYIYKDTEGTIWLGSHGHGLYRLVSDQENKFEFECFTTKDGLPNNNIFGIVEDDFHNLWLTTDYGLSCFNITNRTFRNFTATDGILDNQFYWNAAHKSSYSETMYFGNLAGVIAIQGVRTTKPDTLHVVLTKLTVLNEVVHQGGNQYLNNDIAAAKILELHERDKSFSIEFSALNYNNTKNVKYAYRLKGFDEQWIESDGNRHSANYTNLNSGKYVFQVKVLPTDNYVSGEMTELYINIRPFFYKTWWFYSIIIMIIIVSTSTFYLWRISALQRQKKILTLTVQERTKELKNKTIELSKRNIALKEQCEKINQQKVELVKMSKKIQETTNDKIAFFTNITHEFRTPITLIAGPIERAIHLSHNPEVLEQLHIVDRNSKSLLSLVNQILDFRKVETNHIEIKKKNNNLIELIEEILVPFEAFASERNLSIHKFYRLSEPYYLFDEKWIRKVFVNLLSNAIKFTPDGGKIKLYVGNIAQDSPEQDKLYICINDSGIGVPEKDIDKIFDRFYQSNEPVKRSYYGQSGTGIGLYLCERIIKQHGGVISVKNNKTQGASFRVILHLARGTSSASNNEVSASIAHVQSDSQSVEIQKQPNQRTILLVEDNEDMRSYIRSVLCKQYHVLEAENGLKALHVLAENSNVDFIISDIIMPVMDGVEFSKRVKKNIATSHLPILMLTAKTAGEVRMESYKIGVDEYLTKPFEEKLLLIRIENILNTRQKYQKLFKINMDPAVLNIDEESKDKKFIDKVMEIMANSYSNPEFEVTTLASEMGMSKTLLNLKLQELTGQSTAKFIRIYRLNLAHKLILTNKTTKNMNISEIAYEVGFNDPKYFTRVFYNHFGVSPSGLMGKNGE